MLQATVVQNTVIYPLAGSPFTINIFVCFRFPRDSGMKTQISMVLDINRAAIAAGRTGFDTM